MNVSKDNKPALGFTIIAIIFLLLIVGSIMLPMAHARQTQPDSKRVKQIQTALVEHSHAPGKTWAETQETLRSIAKSRGWQTQHAPDARVLILLGLGNTHSDSQVLDWPTTRLEGGDPDGE